MTTQQQRQQIEEQLRLLNPTPEPEQPAQEPPASDEPTGPRPPAASRGQGSSDTTTAARDRAAAEERRNPAGAILRELRRAASPVRAEYQP